MHPHFIKHFLKAVAILGGIRKLAAAQPVDHGDMAIRYDYEPGDTLNRTMCFCTSDASLQQTDNDPEAFYNTTQGHSMRYIYEFRYYNHRLDKHVVITDNRPETVCLTKTAPEDPYYHNDCLAWEKQNMDLCADYVLDNLPADVEVKNPWQFCYLFRGDTLDDPTKRDFFKFDGGERAIPRARDWIEPAERVAEVCRPKCEEKGMQLFESKYGGWFNRMDGFNRFDDICTNDMNCTKPPAHVKSAPDTRQGAGVNAIVPF